MITCYFGIPGVGKSTLLTKFAQKELKKIKHHRSNYDRVYTNFCCKGCYKITYDDLKDYKIYNSLILLDELTLDADNRKFKEFSDGHRDFFILHRHLGCDIIYATQMYDKIDVKIQALTQELWYMSKSVIPFLSNFTNAKRIYRNININEHTSDLVLGYRFCNLIESFFTSNYKIVFRPKYYKYFDSFDEGKLVNREVLTIEKWNFKTKPSILSKLKKVSLHSIVSSGKRLKVSIRRRATLDTNNDFKIE